MKKSKTAGTAMNRQIFIERAVLAGIVLIGAGLRFHNLGVPSMWWDEVLVPLISRFPAASILEWLRFIEVHPPLYYLLTKLVMHVDASDATLRLLSAVPGVLSIYVIYRIGKDLFGATAGLAAAGLLAANPYAVWLSRLVRPYSLFLLLFLLALWALESWARTGGRKAFWGLVAANLALFWTHYMMVILAPVFGLAVLFRSWPRLRDFWVFCAGEIASFATILPFFLQNFARPHWLGSGGPWHILAGVGVSVVKLAWFFKGPVAWTILGAALFGLFPAARRSRGAFWTGLALAVVPVGLVMAAELAWTHEPRYFLFIMPLVLLSAGLGLESAMEGRRTLGALAGLGLALGLGAALLTHARSYYAENSLLGIDWISYKTVARMIPPIVKAGEPVVASEEGLQNALDWYLERQGGPNPIRSARLAPDDREAVVNFLWFERMGHLAATKQELAGLFPGLVEVGTVDKLTFFKAVVPRVPVQTASAAPWERRFSGLRGFLGASHALEGLVVTPYWGEELEPGANDVPGFVEYAVENAGPDFPRRIELACRYANEGRGNQLRVLARFDGEPWTDAMASQGPDPHVYRRVFLDREAPFKRLTVRVEMRCARLTAQYPGGNLGSLRLKDLLIAFPAG